MKTFRMFGMALVAVVLGFAMSSCENDDDVDPYKDYPQLIVGKWFCFTPESSIFMNYQADGSFYQVGYATKNGWRERIGTYEINENIVNGIITNMDNTPDVIEIVELSKDKFVLKTKDSSVHTSYRVQEQFDITGKYAYLNSAVRVDAKAGKTEIKLPEGITFGGKNTISVEALHGDRIVEQMKSFFADAMFTPNAKLRHTVDGTVMYKDYALDGNNLSFELNKGHELNATSFPDEDGDRLFIIIPKQEAWVGGLADVIRKENPANVITDEVVAALEKEFMDTFETFTVVLSLSKTGEYNAAEDVNPYKDYPQLIVGKWFCFTPESSIFMNYQADGTFYQVGYASKNGWREYVGTYEINENKVIGNITGMDNTPDVEIVELSNDKLVLKKADSGVHTNYRVQSSFDIKGNYSYLNSVARVVPAEGKTALQLPEGFLFNGENTIPVESLNGERIIDASKAFFADATFAEDGKLNHTMNGEAKVKNYTLNGNNLVFNLYEGSDVYNINATSFPDEDGDRLFIIMPKQAAWIGGFVSIIEEQNEGKKFSEAQIAELEKEFMATFETFTVILSLSKK